MSQLTQSGLADLTLGRRDGRTRLLDRRTRSPLTIQRALYLDDGLTDIAFVFVANPTAGLLSGDHHQIRVRLQPDARAHVSTQAATKVLSMPSGRAVQEVELSLDAGSVLEFLPEPLIPFRAARLDQRTFISVEDSATLFYGDVVGGGRIGHGERFAFEHLGLELNVARPSGQVLHLESAVLQPQRGPLGVRGIFGCAEITAVGTLVVVSPAVSPSDLIGAVASDADLPGLRRGAAELPGGGGIVVKILGTSISAVRGLLRDAWRSCRLLILGAEIPAEWHR